MQSTRMAWLVCVKLILCSVSFGQLVQWNAVGTIQNSQGFPEWLRDGESPLSFEISFATDRLIPAVETNPDFASYATIDGFAKVGSHSWTFSDPSSTFFIGNFGGQYRFFLVAHDQTLNIQFVLSLSTSKHSGNLEIPTSIPPIEDFDVIRDMWLSNNVEPGFSAITTIDTFTLTPIVPVPEPSTYGMFGILALLGLVVQRRLRKGERRVRFERRLAGTMR